MYNSTEYYYVMNLQGDIIGLVNAAGHGLLSTVMMYGEISSRSPEAWPVHLGRIIRSDTVGIIMIQRQGSIIYPAVITILRLVGL